jgi:hypothetical protein
VLPILSLKRLHSSFTLDLSLFRHFKANENYEELKKKAVKGPVKSSLNVVSASIFDDPLSGGD